MRAETDDDGAMDAAAQWEAIVVELRRPPDVAAAAVARILAAAAPEDSGTPVRRSWTAARTWWPIQRRRTEISWAHAIAAAALIATLGVVAGRQSVGGAVRPALRSDARSTSLVAAAGSESTRAVQFVLVADGAREVSLVGDFNDWQAGVTNLERIAPDGVWSVEVGLEPGRYTYAFLIDGERWVPDEAAPRVTDQEFGGEKSVVFVRART